MRLSRYTFTCLFLLLVSTQGGAETRYITDQFEVTLRSGTSTSNNIISMLKSGQAVTVLEEDVATKYSLVETENGKKGYVLTRFLDIEPSGRERLATLQVSADKLRGTIEQLRTELNEYKNIKKDDTQKISTLQNNLTRTEQELEDLKEATRDTIRVLEQNDTLKTRINELEADKLTLSEENAGYKDTTARDWFVRGAAVTLIAFLLGILVTRIRWKKRDSWGSY